MYTFTHVYIYTYIHIYIYTYTGNASPSANVKVSTQRPRVDRLRAFGGVSKFWGSRVVADWHFCDAGSWDQNDGPVQFYKPQVRKMCINKRIYLERGLKKR